MAVLTVQKYKSVVYQEILTRMKLSIQLNAIETSVKNFVTHFSCKDQLWFKTSLIWFWANFCMYTTLFCRLSCIASHSTTFKIWSNLIMCSFCFRYTQSKIRQFLKVLLIQNRSQWGSCAHFCCIRYTKTESSSF